MKIKSEQQLMKKLGIETWRNLSKDKMMQFAAMMPNMDKEVMLKVIEQFPEFAKLGKNILTSLEESVKNLSSTNSTDYQAILEVIKETQEILKMQLENVDLNFQERQYVIENLIKITERVCDLDNNNKKFLRGLNNDKVKGIGMVLLTAVVALGGKVIFNKYNDDK